MNILDRSQNMKRVSSNKGGEYHGPCPLCGGVDRFHIWPQQDDGRGSWWCRGCDKGGDALQWLRDIDGLTYRQACQEIGKEYNPSDDHSEPAAIAKGKTAFIAAQAKPAEQAWQEKAEKFVQWSHDNLLNDTETLTWLADQRGISLATVKQLRLGLNSGEKSKDLYRARSAWGLDTQIKDNGQAKKLWLPRGLTIPHYLDGQLCRVRIRRVEGEPRYYVVPGSTGSPMLLDGTPPRPWKVIIVVESELDAIMLNSLAGDLAAYLAMGSSHTKPDAAVLSGIIEQQRGRGAAVQIRIALDNDQAGQKAGTWWLENFKSTLHPVPGCWKDPGEAFQNGIDLRLWVESALPAAYGIAQPETLTLKTSPLTLDQSPVTSHQSLVHTITAQDGRQINITDDRAEYRRLVSEGKIVFSSKEMALVKRIAETPDRAAVFIDIKQVFPGAVVGHVDPDHVRAEATRPQYQGKYTKEAAS